MPARGLSIRTLVTLMVVAPMALLAMLLVWLSSATSARVAGDLARRLVNAASARTVAETRHYLEDAVRTSDLYARRVIDGSLSASDLATWEDALIREVRATPRIAAMTFATPDGSSVMVMRSPAGLELGRVKGGENEQHRIYAIDAAGRVSQTASRTERYDARQRPWYGAAVESPGPTWSPIYTWFIAQRGEDSTIGTGYTRAVRTPTGELIGVLLVDVTLEGLTTYLKSLPLEQTGRVLIIDEQERMVASSVSHVVRPDGQRYLISDVHPDAAQNELLRSASIALRSPAAAQTEGGEIELKRFRLDDQWKRAKIAAATPFPGISWKVLTIMPESLFMSQVDRTRRRAAWLGAGAVLASVVVGLALARRLSRPVEQLSDHVKRIGSGDFASRVNLRAARELSTLSDELNKAAAGLKHRMELEHSLAVAMEVQQSLLPTADPKLDRLDVAGRTTYCDATGGDYYDFLDARPLNDGQSLIVLGDVMGHGVAAALLMATARAALRTHALDGQGDGSLSHLLDKVNRILAADNRHNRFMTLALMVVDPASGSVRWASAGHDPVLVFKAGSAEVHELGSDDIPLGLDADWTYHEFRRADLGPGDVLVIGSDGIWEQPSASGERFGKERMRQAIARSIGLSATDIAKALEVEMAQFRGPTAITDDVTYVIAKVR